MSIREKLESELATANWTELKPHRERGGLILVAASQSLVSVGVAFHEDDKSQVEKWLANGAISKCSSSQAKEFEESEHELKFEYLILQPFVLVKKIKPNFH